MGTVRENVFMGSSATVGIVTLPGGPAQPQTVRPDAPPMVTLAANGLQPGRWLTTPRLPRQFCRLEDKTSGMNNQFIDRIETPSSRVLEDVFENAVQNVQGQLNEYGASDLDEWALRKIAFTYYYDWETDDPNYVFLLKDPGPLNERHTRELERIAQLKNGYEPRDLIEIYRQFATTWFVETRNADFMRRFVRTCATNDLIEPDDSWQDYVRSQAFFDDFYMSDIVKYRAERGAVGTRAVRASFSEFLRPELEHIDPDLIITFGNRAWNPIQEELQPLPVEDPDVDTSKITELHGHLHETQRIVDAYVLPLGHMSTQFYGAQLPKEEYMDRFADGLEAWQIASSDWEFDQ